MRINYVARRALLWAVPGIIIGLGLAWYGLIGQWSASADTRQVMLPVLLVLLLLEIRLLDRSDSWVLGFFSERHAGKVLNQLPGEFFVLSDLVLRPDRGNVDFVVVGPTGIWSIEVKGISGRITFDGKQLLRNGAQFSRDFLKQAWAQAYATRDVAREVLARDVVVQPVLAFTERAARFRFGFQRQGGVYVVGSNWLNRLISSYPVGHLTKDEIIRVVAKLRELRQ